MFPWYTSRIVAAGGIQFWRDSLPKSPELNRGTFGLVIWRGPSWGHLLVVLGAILSFLEPSYWHLLPKVDKFPCELTFEIPPRRALRGHLAWPDIAARLAEAPMPVSAGVGVEG